MIFTDEQTKQELTERGWEITEVDPRTLSRHPIHREIYGDEPIEASFVLACRRWIEPVIITSDRVIISGYRRVQAAIILRKPVIDAIVRHDLTDPLEIEKVLITCNITHRVKTPEEIAREVAELADIRAQRERTRNA